MRGSTERALLPDSCPAKSERVRLYDGGDGDGDGGGSDGGGGEGDGGGGEGEGGGGGGDAGGDGGEPMAAEAAQMVKPARTIE